ncbi:glycoside hydrolase family 97 C-terminal domain-containing protein [Parabacteroides sp. AF48-14]|uniref:glycoside hydrolase family 97 C-terminal domain-containing protein n=1 Tax=Parabacteroides sp. AF48-14 TaxID=2292052 RepID=UPI0021084707|nr:glycoside hydrolase family 97 C-terminal domain-containing protein [Parabacteroides sp. AF48-14]
MPSVWDETIVLPESSISSMAILARRKGDDWYWIALNGGTSNAVKVNAGFLGRGTWKSYSIMDDMQDARNVIKNEKEVASGEEWIIEMRQNGGAVIQFVREQEGI